MHGVVLRLRLFYISYVPLLVTLVFRTFPRWDHLRHHPWSILVPLVFLVLALAGVLLGVALLKAPRRLSGTTITITEVGDAGSEAAGYLGSYILPWIMFSQSSWQVWAAFGAYAVTLTVVAVSSRLVLVNPTLYLLGRRVLTVRVPQLRGPGQEYEVTTLLICRNVPIPGDTVHVVSIADAYLEKNT